ncbi:putative fructose-bisphosphate aldolase [Helianthus anomalus]
MKEAGVLFGIKVDKGTVELVGTNGKTTAYVVFGCQMNWNPSPRYPQHLARVETVRVETIRVETVPAERYGPKRFASKRFYSKRYYRILFSHYKLHVLFCAV